MRKNSECRLLVYASFIRHCGIRNIFETDRRPSKVFVNNCSTSGVYKEKENADEK